MLTVACFCPVYCMLLEVLRLTWNENQRPQTDIQRDPKQRPPAQARSTLT